MFSALQSDGRDGSPSPQPLILNGHSWYKNHSLHSQFSKEPTHAVSITGSIQYRSFAELFQNADDRTPGCS
jgi:hypothetical protein